MNFIAATVVLKSTSPDPVTAYGLSYRSADAVVPGGNGNSEVRLRLLCYDRAGAKLDAFTSWKEGNRALITGNLVFSDDTSKPLDLIVSTIETNVPQDMYCNQVVLGNAFFGSDEVRDRKNSQCAVKIGTTLDNSDVTTWLYLETHESRKPKLTDESVKDALFVCKGTSANIAKMIVTVLTVPLSRLTSLLEKTSNELDRTHKRAVRQLDTRKLIRHRITERDNYITNDWYGWSAPIYDNENN